MTAAAIATDKCRFLSDEQAEALNMRAHAAYSATRGTGHPPLLNAAGRGDLDGVKAALRGDPRPEEVRAAAEIAIARDGHELIVDTLLSHPLTPLEHHIEHFFHAVGVGNHSALRHLGGRMDLVNHEHNPLRNWIDVACQRGGLEHLTLVTIEVLVHSIPEAVFAAVPALLDRCLELMAELSWSLVHKAELDGKEVESLEAFEAMSLDPLIVKTLQEHPESALHRNPLIAWACRR